MNDWDKFWCRLDVETSNGGRDFINGGAQLFNQEPDEFRGWFVWVAVIVIIVITIAIVVLIEKRDDIMYAVQQRKTDREYRRASAERARLREARLAQASQSKEARKPQVDIIQSQDGGGASLRINPSPHEDTEEVTPMSDTTPMYDNDVPEEEGAGNTAPMTALFKAMLRKWVSDIENQRDTPENLLARVEEFLDPEGPYLDIVNSLNGREALKHQRDRIVEELAVEQRRLDEAHTTQDA